MNDLTRNAFINHTTKAIEDDVASIATALRRLADEVEATGREMHEPETAWTKLEDRARRIMHDVMWALPNLRLEQLLKDVQNFREAEAYVAAREEKTDA